MGRDKKEQLGARVTPGVRTLAVNQAKQEGLSLNLWVEKIILAATDGVTPEPKPPLEGQTTVDDFVEAAVPGGGPAASTKPFAADCSMVSYHWRCSPGNPCRRCGGEV